jgi:S1-C subfamily serine protease
LKGRQGVCQRGSSNDLILILEKYKIGDNVRVKVLRDEKEQEVMVRLQGSK